MAAISVTITDITKGPFQVRTMFGFNADLPTGVTVAPTLSSTVPSQAPRIPASLVIESASTSGQLAYWGDSKLSTTSANALVMSTGGSYPSSFSKSYVPTDGEYINASANGAVLKISADGGTP